MTTRGTETRSAKTEGLGPKDDGPVPSGTRPSPCFTTPNPILEGVELREAYARVREALEKWKCPSCGGAKTYMQRTGQNPGTIIPCKVCQETGLHPTAREALSGLSLPGRDAETRVTPEQNEALHKALLASGTPVAPPISGDAS